MKETKQIINEFYHISSDGILYNHENRMILGYIASGYRSYKVKYGLDKRASFLAHRLVWEAWVGPIPKGHWINHEDGNKLNNDLSNLKCETPSYNHLHASIVLKRKYAKGLDTATGVLSEVAVEALHFLKLHGWSQNKIGKLFNISQAAVHGQLNKHLKKPRTGKRIEV